MAARLRLAYGSLASTVLHSTRACVVRCIALLVHGDVSQSAEGRASVLTLQDALTMMLSISRQTLSKELQTLVELDAIHLRYGHIEIQDMALLSDASEAGVD